MDRKRLSHVATRAILPGCLIALMTMTIACSKAPAVPKTAAGAEVSAARQKVVDIDSTEAVTAYYPLFSRIDLVCGTMPGQDDERVVFCAEAAFTHELLDEFAHTNIDGDHVSGGRRYAGARCKDNSGAFISWDDHWEFVQGDYGAALDSAVAHDGMGFGQASIIHGGKRVPELWRGGVNHYRALCRRGGRLCVVDSRKAVEYKDFVDMLEQYGVDEALYLDMGSGWNHSWWRDDDGSVREIHPRLDKCRYCTNWITFYR